MRKLLLIAFILFSSHAWASRAFDGTASKIFSAAGVTNLGDYTMCIVMRWDKSSGDQVSRGISSVDGGSTNFFVINPSNGTLNAFWQAGVAGTGSSTSQNIVQRNHWVIQCMIRIGTTIHTYFDGTSEGNFTVGAGTFSTPVIAVGARADSVQFCPCTIGEVGIWNFGMTDAVMSKLAGIITGAAIGYVFPLRVLFPLNMIFYYANAGVSTSTEPDLSGKSNNGTVTSAAQSATQCSCGQPWMSPFLRP